MYRPERARTPFNEAIVVAVAGLVELSASRDTAKSPSHSDITQLITEMGLGAAEPPGASQAGKRKRTENVLRWALKNDRTRGAEFVRLLLERLRGWGGFRDGSSNFVGEDERRTAIAAFAAEGWQLSEDGLLLPASLETLAGEQLTEALQAYARRAMEGSLDAAQLAGTSKDLLEAVARHVLVVTRGDYPRNSNFPSVLGFAFVDLGLTTSQHPTANTESAESKLQRALFDGALAVNSLRNVQGTGHGRPMVSNLDSASASAAARMAGTVTAYLLEKAATRPG